MAVIINNQQLLIIAKKNLYLRYLISNLKIRESNFNNILAINLFEKKNWCTKWVLIYGFDAHYNSNVINAIKYMKLSIPNLYPV